MESHYELFENPDVFKNLLTNIDFENRVLLLKQNYPYYKNGVHVVKLKIDLERDVIYNNIKNILEKENIQMKFLKSENMFFHIYNFNEITFEFIIKIDSNSIGGAFIVDAPWVKFYDNIDERLGDTFDGLLEKYFDYTNECYRYCPLNFTDVQSIIYELLSIKNDFFVELKKFLNFS